MELMLRWMTPRDFSVVADIEFDSFEYPWDWQDFSDALSHHSRFGLVVDVINHPDIGADKSAMAGFVVVEKQGGTRRSMHIYDIACAPRFRRLGVGSALVQRVISLAKAQNFGITLEVRETNLAAQLFFKNNGFRATKILSECYDELSEDAYHFTFDGISKTALTRPTVLT